MEFWLIMIGFIVMGGSCSLAGTWWDRKNKKESEWEMELDIIGLLGACSYALDCVEAELTHVATKHGKRVTLTFLSILFSRRT